MPIYRETLDDPVGQVHIKDVFKMLVDERIRPAPERRCLRRLRREILYAPGSMRAADLLVRMQASRIHLALIIDEFGGTDGLVTLEDSSRRSSARSTTSTTKRSPPRSSRAQAGCSKPMAAPPWRI